MESTTVSTVSTAISTISISTAVSTVSVVGFGFGIRNSFSLFLAIVSTAVSTTVSTVSTISTVSSSIVGLSFGFGFSISQGASQDSGKNKQEFHGYSRCDYFRITHRTASPC